MNASDLEKKLASIEQLPSLPLVIRQVQKIMENPKSNMNQIALVIAKDQALASKTIKLVNSAFYGMSKNVSSITQAIIILGLNTVNNIMMAISVVKMFPNKGEKTFDQEKFWEHAFATALIARSIAKKERYEDPEVCFISGLLHDVGRLVFDQFLHDNFYKAFTLAKSNNAPLIQIEQAILGADHAFAGGFLAQRWKLPEQILSAVKFHHSLGMIPEEFAKYQKIIMIVAKADQIANKAQIGSSGERYICSDNNFTSLKIEEKDIDEIVDQVKAEVKATVEEWRR